MATKKAHAAHKGASKKGKIAAGIGAGLALAAAGAYLLSGKKGAKNRQTLKAWAAKAKVEVMKEAKRMKAMDQSTYNRIIDQVSRRYGALQNVDRAELATTVAELRRHWASLKGQMAKNVKKATARKAPARRPTAKKGGSKKKAGR